MRELFTDIIGNKFGEGIKREYQYRMAFRHLDRYVKYKNINDTISMKNTKVKLNQTIWICWLQGMENAPIIVRKCYESIKRNIPDIFDIKVITEKTINDYISFPPFIYEKVEKGIISKTHFSDIIRTELLYQYGGCWIDATVFCSRKIPDYMLSGDLFFFKWSIMDISVLPGSSWWIYAKQNNKIVREVRNVLYAYWKNESKLINYYLYHIILAKIINSDAINRISYNDMIYCNNSTPQILYSLLAEQFNEERWEILDEQTPVHKLSYKRNFIRGDIESFFVALMKGKLDTGEYKV